MSRPLMQHGVGQLEDMFGNCRGSPQILRELENELQYRQTPRAHALLEKVQAAMAATGAFTRELSSRAPTTPAPSPPAPLKQPNVWGEAPSSEVPGVGTPPVPPVASALPPQVLRPASPARPADPPSVSKPAAPITPTMPIEDAYKLLKATAGSTWESIEQTRRQLVQQAHPSRVRSIGSERRAQHEAEARRVNAAYAVLSKQRASAG